jgi:hypothetical protein
MGTKNAEYYARWYAKNREKDLAKRRARYASDPETRLKKCEASRLWKAKNPDKVAAYNLEYKIRVATA